MSQRRLLKWRLTRGAEPAAPVPAPRRCGRARARARDQLRGFTAYCPVPLSSVAGGAGECGARAGTRIPRAGAA